MTSPLTLPDRLGGVSVEALRHMALGSLPGEWAEARRGFRNAPFHWEWYDLVKHGRRVAVVAPREHAKSEVFTVNATAWRSIYQPGLWTYLFSSTATIAEGLLARIVDAVDETAPELTRRMLVDRHNDVVFANGARVSCAGVGKEVRSTHPDVVIGDDVLTTSNTRSSEARKALSKWWFGTVANMAHPGTVRRLPDRSQVSIAATKIMLIGTPFHQGDLLMGMRENDIYTFRRYAAEFHDSERVVRPDGSRLWAVEATKVT